MGDVHLLCLAGRQMTTNAALSIYNTVTLWPKAELEVCLSVFRIKPKLPSMPHQLQEIHRFSLACLPFPASPALDSHPGTPSKGVCLMFFQAHCTLLLLHLFTRPSLCLPFPAWLFWPWKRYGLYEFLLWSPRLLYLLFSWLYPPIEFLQHIEFVFISVSHWVVWSSKTNITSCLSLSPILSRRKMEANLETLCLALCSILLHFSHLSLPTSL